MTNKDDVTMEVTYTAHGRYSIWPRYGGTEDEARALAAQADAEWLTKTRSEVLDVQARIDEDLSAGKSYAIFRGSDVVHTTDCSMVKYLLDRDSVWRKYQETLAVWELSNDYYAPPNPPRAPALFHRHEVEARNATRRRCELCAPDIENWKRQSRRGLPGDIIAREIRSVSLKGHHVGDELVLADGTEAGRILEVTVAVRTDTGMHFIGQEDKVTVRHEVPDAPSAN